jgi:uncharacterized membrane protein
MNWRETFTKKRLILTIIVIVAAIALSEAYVNSPTLLLWLNPENSISITAVDYPPVAYRSQSLPITIHLSNAGDAKDVLVEVISMDNPTLSSSIRLDGSSSTGNTTILLPLKTTGNQSFSVKVTWIGPSGFCKINQNSTDKSFEVLAADYDASSPTIVASRAESFSWTLSVTNTGNTPANLTVQLYKKDPLILSDASGGTVKIANIQVGETRAVSFQFAVPHDASLGDHTLTVSFTTTYPNIAYYTDCKEAYYQNFNYNIQESTIKTQLDNTGYILAAAVALLVVVGGGTVLAGKGRGSH